MDKNFRFIREAIGSIPWDYVVIGTGLILLGFVLGKDTPSEVLFDFWGAITAIATLMLAVFARNALGEYKHQVRFANAMEAAERLYMDRV